MNWFFILVIRLIFGAVFALILIRMFRPSGGPLHMAGLCLVLVGLAYGLEYYRKRNRDNH